MGFTVLEAWKADDVHYQIAILDQSYLDQIKYLQELIVKEINDTIVYDPVALEDIKKRFKQEGRIIGIFSNTQLIGCRIIHFPPPDSDNFGIDINLLESELPKVAHLAATIVHSTHRGSAFAYKMNLHAIEIIKALGYRHLCSTVFPGNIANISTQFKTGLFIRGLKEKYGGKLRYIFYKDLQKTKVIQFKETKRIPINDIKGQVDLISAGYIGCKLEITSGEIRVLYSLGTAQK